MLLPCSSSSNDSNDNRESDRHDDNRDSKIIRRRTRNNRNSGHSSSSESALLCRDESARSELSHFLRHVASLSAARPYMSNVAVPEDASARADLLCREDGVLVAAAESGGPLLSPAGLQLRAQSALVEFGSFQSSRGIRGSASVGFAGEAAMNGGRGEGGSMCLLDAVHSFRNCSVCEDSSTTTTTTTTTAVSRDSSYSCQRWMNTHGQVVSSELPSTYLDENGLLHLVNTISRVFVLIFVEEGVQLEQARAAVDLWRGGCSGCPFVASFIVYTVPACAVFAGPEEGSCELR